MKNLTKRWNVAEILATTPLIVPLVAFSAAILFSAH